MKFEEIERKMRELAKENEVVPTEYLPKIAKAREIMKIDISVCPCAKTEEEKKQRGCISPMCLKEIMEKGICKCRCFRRK